MRDEGKPNHDLEQEVRQYRKIFETLHEGYLLVDQDAYIYDVNAAYCAMSGYSRDELLSMKLTDLRSDLPSNELASLLESLALYGGQQFEAKHQRKNGAIFDLMVSAVAIEKEGRKYVAGLMWDITEQKEAHKKLQEANQRFKSLFEYNPNPVYSFDLEGNFQRVNDQTVAFAGISREELLKMSFRDFIEEKDLEKVQQNFENAKEGIANHYELTVWVRDEEKREVRVTKFPMFVDGEITGVYSILQDITEQKEAERKIKENEEKWESLVKNSPQPIEVIDLDGNILLINQAGADMYGGGSTNELTGVSLALFNDPEIYENIRDRLRRMDKGLPVDDCHKHKIINKKGEERYVEVYSTLINYQGERAVQSVYHDITDSKKKEQIIQASLEEKKVMLQEIHHRVKNNMAVVSGLLELQAMNMDDEKMKEILKGSQLRIHSMAMIHEKLYASKSLSNISFAEYVKQLSQIVIDSAQEDGTDITIRYELDEIELNITQAIPCGLILNELLVNCFKHAFDEQNAGTILIGLKKNGKEIQMFVEDNGSGLPDDFVIEEQDSLGIKLIHTLTHQLEGELEVKPGANSLGTCFKVQFAQKQH